MAYFEKDHVELPLLRAPYSRNSEAFLIWDSKQFTIRNRLFPNSDIGIQDREPALFFRSIQSVTWKNATSISVSAIQDELPDQLEIVAMSEYLKTFLDIAVSQNPVIRVDETNMNVARSPEQIQNAKLNLKYIIAFFIIMALIAIVLSIAGVN